LKGDEFGDDELEVVGLDLVGLVGAWGDGFVHDTLMIVTIISLIIKHQ